MSECIELPTEAEANEALGRIVSVTREYALKRTPSWLDPLSMQHAVDTIDDEVTKILAFPDEFLENHPAFAEVVRSLILSRT